MKTKKVVSQIYLWLVLAVLYAPIIFIAIFSFTQAKSLGNWTGFTLDLYKSLFTGATSGSQALMEALKNTLFIALVASLVSTVLGTLAAIGIFNMRGRWKKSIQFLNNVPMLNPDIITGVSLFLLFVFLGVSKGYTTIILSHITFCTPYVVLNVMPKLVQMNPNIYDAGSQSFPGYDEGDHPSTQDRYAVRLHPCIHDESGRLCRNVFHGRIVRNRHSLHFHLCRCAKGRSHSGAQAYDDNHFPAHSCGSAVREPEGSQKH